MHVVVVGPMSSGCRLLRRVLDASPNLTCWLDTSHGTGELIENGNLIPKEAKVLVILRDRNATEASREKRWGKTEYNIHYEDSLAGINNKYPDAFAVLYEDLCNNPKKEIERIATHLKVPVWKYSKRIYKNRNKKWLQ